MHMHTRVLHISTHMYFTHAHKCTSYMCTHVLHNAHICASHMHTHTYFTQVYPCSHAHTHLHKNYQRKIKQEDPGTFWTFHRSRVALELTIEFCFNLLARVLWSLPQQRSYINPTHLHHLDIQDCQNLLVHSNRFPFSCTASNTLNKPYLYFQQNVRLAKNLLHELGLINKTNGWDWLPL